jgi:hypothetical protein
MRRDQCRHFILPTSLSMGDERNAMRAWDMHHSRIIADESLDNFYFAQHGRTE